MNFASTSTLDDQEHPLLIFFSLKEHKLFDFTILAWDVVRLIQTFDLTKVTDPDKRKMIVVLKKFSPELSPILTKLFNCSLERQMCPKSVEIINCLLCLQECW